MPFKYTYQYAVLYKAYERGKRIRQAMSIFSAKLLFDPHVSLDNNFLLSGEKLAFWSVDSVDCGFTSSVVVVSGNTCILPLSLTGWSPDMFTDCELPRKEASSLLNDISDVVVYKEKENRLGIGES